jgi:hypothetical protein
VTITVEQIREAMVGLARRDGGPTGRQAVWTTDRRRRAGDVRGRARTEPTVATATVADSTRTRDDEQVALIAETLDDPTQDH